MAEALIIYKIQKNPDLRTKCIVERGGGDGFVDGELDEARDFTLNLSRMRMFPNKQLEKPRKRVNV